MTQTKPILTSKTILAAFIGIVLVFAEGLYGFRLSDAATVNLVDNAFVLLAFAGTIWGRMTAKRRLK